MAPRSKRSRKSQQNSAWWDLWPGLYSQELSAFDQRGVLYEVALKKGGFLILEADWPIAGQDPLKLRIGFSPLHPFCRPAVAAPEQSFERHQNPFNMCLCLLTQEARQWDSRQLIADFIDERLQQFMGALEARRQKRWEDAAELEEQAADPMMPYFPQSSNEASVVLFDGHMQVPDEDHGLMDLDLWPRYFNNGESFEAVLRNLKTPAGRAIGRTFSLPSNPPHERRIPGYWVRLSQPPFSDDPKALLGSATEELERQGVMRPKAVEKLKQVTEKPFWITGIVFPEEIEYGQEKTGAGWLFLACRRRVNGGPHGPSDVSIVHGVRVGEREIFARLPVASNLRPKTVLLVGCGAIGSFAAVEIARAGVGNLTLLDGDFVQPGNSLRWPLGRTTWGVAKSMALHDFIERNYPWTKMSHIHIHLGGATTNPADLSSNLKGRPSYLARLREFIQETDLVIDASASTELQHALSFHCRDLGKPYVMGYATEGLAGGIVAHFTPRSKGCWVCLNEHWKDGKKDGPVSRLRVDKTGVVTPVGCNQPTFTGGSFDLQEVSLEIVRRAIGLLAGAPYARGGRPVAILELQDDDGHRILPKWASYDLPPHPRCCGTR